MSGTTKQLREASFHDKVFSEGGRSVGRFYSVTRSSKAFYRMYIAENCRSGTVLEYGCGPDSHSMFIAPKGAKVVGIDISPVAIRQYNQVAADHQLVGVQGCVMDAERLAFPEATFDLICGLGILHHLDIDRCYAELSRTMKPNGSAVFLEPLGHNPLINAYRKRTPDMRTPDEHPLLVADIESASRYFGRVEKKYFHLASLAVIPLAGAKGFSAALRCFDMVDAALFKYCRPLRKHAWAVALVLRDPKQ